MFEHLCATLLQQSHLCPVPLEAQPVFWNFDHALHLYPIPDVLVLADRAPCASFAFPPMPADQLDQSCVCLNPVSAQPLSPDAGRPLPNDIPACKRLMWCYPTVIRRQLWAPFTPLHQGFTDGQECTNGRGTLAWHIGRALHLTADLLKMAAPCRGPS